MWNGDEHFDRLCGKNACSLSADLEDWMPYPNSGIPRYLSGNLLPRHDLLQGRPPYVGSWQEPIVFFIGTAIEARSCFLLLPHCFSSFFHLFQFRDVINGSMPPSRISKLFGKSKVVRKRSEQISWSIPPKNRFKSHYYGVFRKYCVGVFSAILFLGKIEKKNSILRNE